MNTAPRETFLTSFYVKTIFDYVKTPGENDSVKKKNHPVYKAHHDWRKRYARRNPICARTYATLFSDSPPLPYV